MIQSLRIMVSNDAAIGAFRLIGPQDDVVGGWRFAGSAGAGC